MAAQQPVVLVAGGVSFAAVSVGINHTCGRTAAGAAYCWGANAAGQLGDGTTTDRSSAVPVAGGVSFTAVSTSTTDHTCGMTAAGAAYCWGNNASGQLGDGTTTNRSTPVRVVQRGARSCRNAPTRNRRVRPQAGARRSRASAARPRSGRS